MNNEGHFAPQTLTQLCQLATQAARAAGEVINAHRGPARRDGIKVETKAIDTSLAGQLVTEVDRKAQAAIIAQLSPSCHSHDLALLAEEERDDGERQRKPAFWCIDPLDGTLPFVKGIPGFSVSIALVARDGSPLIGVVLDPIGGDLYHAIQGQGGWKNDQPIPSPPLDPNQPLILRTDFSFEHHPWYPQTRAGLDRIAAELGLNGAEIHFRTGAVLNACELLETPHICYFKYPRTSENGGSLWDYAASACLFQELGAIASDLFGNPMELNRPASTFMNHRGILYTSHTPLAEKIIQLHRTIAAADES
jgi:3'(2'), 5'-bisphosphate nucleotidase/myo-inositol-1(or 4)-monophosphatase